MKKIFVTIFVGIVGSILYTGVCFAEIVIIGHPDIKINALTSNHVGKIYLAKITSINGVKIKPVDCEPLQKDFLAKHVGKTARFYKKAWIKKIFSEGAEAPVMLSSEKDVINYVKNKPNSIGYVSSAPDGVKILLK